MKRILAFTACLAMSCWFMLACDKQSPVASNPELGGDEVSLEKDFGGYTNSDEAPNFGDEEVMAEAGEDENVSDPLSLEAAANLTAAGLKAYEVRLTWGLLEGDSTATDVIDWSGSIGVSRGVLAVLKVIRFERSQGDHLQVPRTSRKELAFASHTQMQYDGLLLLIVDRDTTNTPGELKIQAGSYSRTFTFEELDSLNVVEPVGPNANAVSIISRSKAARPFAGGFLAGRWMKTNERGGEFHGRWINSEGTNAGSLRGIWGLRRNGEKVFFGKYVGLNGEFGGVIAGHWRYDRDERGGVFEGKWFNRDRQENGTLAGHFKLGRPGDGRGFFHGRWFQRG